MQTQGLSQENIDTLRELTHANAINGFCGDYVRILTDPSLPTIKDKLVMGFVAGYLAGVAHERKYFTP